ncbi:MAG: hypothetical protein RIT81_31775 [Deltaproteobacteria bacterium]
MKRITLLVTPFLLIACGGPDSSTAVSQSNSAIADLEQSYAGLSTSDEAPEFGDERVRAEDRAERDVRMPPETDRADGVRIGLTIRYGHLVDRSRPTDARWRFTVAAQGGAFLRGQVITEDREDPELTRRDRSTVSWHSATPAGDHDGARFVLGFGEDARGLAIETAGLTIGIPLRELVDHESMHRTDNGQVYVRASRLHRESDDAECRGGTIRARATGLGDDGVGAVFGVVRNRDGDRIGHIRGRYGVRGDGSHVFFAKLIGLNGNFIARARGTFERIDDETIAVRARFHQRNGDTAGVIHGRIIANDDARGGVFLARWAADCDDSIPRDRMPPASDVAERERSRVD